MRAIWRRKVDLPAHVGTGQHHDLPVVAAEAAVVGHESFGLGGLDHRMSPAFDLDDAVFHDFWTHVVLLGGQLGVGKGDIQFGDRSGGSEEGFDVRGRDWPRGRCRGTAPVLRRVPER